MGRNTWHRIAYRNIHRVSRYAPIELFVIHCCMGSSIGLQSMHKYRREESFGCTGPRKRMNKQNVSNWQGKGKTIVLLDYIIIFYVTSMSFFRLKYCNRWIVMWIRDKRLLYAHRSDGETKKDKIECTWSFLYFDGSTDSLDYWWIFTMF